MCGLRPQPPPFAPARPGDGQAPPRPALTRGSAKRLVDAVRKPGKPKLQPEHLQIDLLARIPHGRFLTPAGPLCPPQLCPPPTHDPLPNTFEYARSHHTTHSIPLLWEVSNSLLHLTSGRHGRLGAIARRLGAQGDDFQRNHRLTVDGIAGVRTQIALAGALASPGSPFLTAAHE